MSDPKFYIDGAKRMIGEGIEAVSSIMAYIKQNEKKLADLSHDDRKKELLQYEPCKLFNSVHPIVFQYLAVEGIFNQQAFRRYVMAVYGKPKSMEEQAEMQKDRRFLYHNKNRQMALYYKYLLIETNPNVNKNTIHSMYEEVVNSLNDETDRMLDAYQKAEDDAKQIESALDDEKRKDFIEMLKRRVNSN